MATTTITQTTCDLCGYGGPYSRPEDFQQRDGHDLCKWCCREPSRGIESGGHSVDISDGSWSCSCGQVYGAVVLRLRMHGVSLAAMDAVPDLPTATASIHVNTPNWPRTY